jgi:hypothetical protein
LYNRYYFFAACATLCLTIVVLPENNRLKQVLTAFLLLLAFGCEKEQSCEKCLPAEVPTNAKILYTGPPAGDGCDWLILADTVYYKPENLDGAYQQSGMDVKINFTLTGDTYICGLAASKIPIIHITSIRK